MADQTLTGDDLMALNQLIAAKDPRAAAVLGKMSDSEKFQFNDWKSRSIDGRQSNDMGIHPFSAATVAGLGGAAKAIISGGIGALMPESVGAAAKGAWNIAKTGAPMVAADYGMKTAGIPYEIRNAIMMAMGLKGGMAGAASKGAVAAEEAAGSKALDLAKMGNMTDEEVRAALTARGSNLGTGKVMPDAKLRLGDLKDNPGLTRLGPEPAPTAAPAQPSVPEYPSNVTRRSATEAVGAGEGPSGGARGVQLRSPSTRGTGPSTDPLPLNVQRTRSAADDMARMEATGGNADAAAHAAGGAARGGVRVEGDHIYDAYTDAKVLKKVKLRSKGD